MSRLGLLLLSWGLLFGAVTGLSGCENLQPEFPGAAFDAVTVKRSVSLVRVLGPQVTLLGPDDTLHLATQFDPSTKRSRIINLADSSFLLDAWVLRHRRLYYMVEPQADSSCWVHTVRIRDGEVRGLLTGFLQMSHLAAAVRKGYAPELVRYRHPELDSIRLRFDIKHLRTFYAAELDSLPAYRLQQSARQASVLPASAIAVPARLYPNPAHTRATLDFSYAGRRTVQLFNTRGQQVRTYDSLAATLDIPVDGLPAGRYIVRIMDAARSHMLQLEVAH